MSLLKKSSIAVLSIAMLAGTLSGCASRSVSRVDANEEIALSDKWNDKDSQLVSEEMINDMLSFPWMTRFSQQNPGKLPALIIQKVRNKSHEHIATDTFVNDMKRAIMRSGRADFVAGGAERADLRDERRDQELNASSDTAKQMGNELGADFVLSGSINSFVDQYKGDRVTFYQVDLKLINMETNREAWNGQKKIKKLQEKKTFGF